MHTTETYVVFLQNTDPKEPLDPDSAQTHFAASSVQTGPPYRWMGQVKHSQIKLYSPRKYHAGIPKNVLFNTEAMALEKLNT